MHTHPWIDSSSSSATSLEPASHLSARYSPWKRRQTSHLSSRWMRVILTSCFSLSLIVCHPFRPRTLLFHWQTSPFNMFVKTKSSSFNVRKAVKLSRSFGRCMDALHNGSVITISPFVSSIKPVQILNNPNIRLNCGRLIINAHSFDHWSVLFSCHGKSNCQILINNELFADPCGLKIPKHFEIHYRCIDRGNVDLRDSFIYLGCVFFPRSTLSSLISELLETEWCSVHRKSPRRVRMFVSADHLSVQWVDDEWFFLSHRCPPFQRRIVWVVSLNILVRKKISTRYTGRKLLSTERNTFHARTRARVCASISTSFLQSSGD